MIKRLILAGAISLFSLASAQAAPVAEPATSGCGTCGQAGSLTMAQNLPPRTVGSAIEVAQSIQIPRNDTGTPSMCCPPIARLSFLSYFRVHQQPGENITQTYGLEFLPTAALDSQMQAFAPFAALVMTTPGRTANSVLLVGDMRATTAPTSAAYNSGTTVSSNFHALRGWWANGIGTWDGTGPSFFRNTFKDQPTPGSFLVPTAMQPNQWYVIRLKFQLAEKDANPQSWYQKDFDCNDAKPIYVAVRVNALGGFKVGGGPTPAPIEIVEVQ